MGFSQAPLSELSPELKAAQEQLLQLRKDQLVEQGASHRQLRAAKHKPSPKYLLDQAQAELSRRRKMDGVQVNHGSPWVSSFRLDRLPFCPIRPATKLPGHLLRTRLPPILQKQYPSTHPSLPPSSKRTWKLPAASIYSCTTWISRVGDGLPWIMHAVS